MRAHTCTHTLLDTRTYTPDALKTHMRNADTRTYTPDAPKHTCATQTRARTHLTHPNTHARRRHTHTRM
jgi:hypothetical protein